MWKKGITNKIAKAIYAFTFVMFVVVTNAKAGEVTNSTYIDKAYLVTGTKVTVNDPHYSAETACPTCFAVNRTFRVRLNYLRNKLTDLLVPVTGNANFWTYQVQYKVYPTATPASFQNGSVMINFAPTGQNVYDDFELHTNIAAGMVTLEVTNVVATYSTDNGGTYITVPAPITSSIFVPSDIRLELISNSQLYTKNDPFVTLTRPFIQFDAASSEIRWAYAEGAEEYDVEWVFIDAKDKTVLTGIDPAIPFNYKAPTRITTSAQYYPLDLTFPAGKLYFRVRAVYRQTVGVGSDYTNLSYRSWEYTANSNINTPPTTYVISNSFDQGKNWQYTINFAEEGKHKQVITYADGSLRPRQTQTRISTDNTIVVAEQKYDSEGRPVVSVLPTPTTSTIFSYQPRFNVDGSAGEFERSDFERGISNPMGNSKGAGQYYSASNPFTNSPFTKYIPDAGGAATPSTADGGNPYTQVTYTRDGSGRVAKQSGVGSDFAINAAGDHETEYYYGTANSRELRSMFGTNVGLASHYKKNMVKDANGQVSLSYLDQEGRVIATSLAGSATSNTLPLESNTGATTVMVNLSENNVVDKQNNRSVINARILNLSGTSSYTFSYDMKGVIYGTTINAGLPPQNIPLCQSCSYKLAISINDPDGLPVQITDPANGQLVSTLTRTFSYPTNPCGVNQYTPAGLTFTQAFTKLGDYTVTKILEIDPNAVSTALASAIGAAGLGQSYLNSLIAQFKLKADTTICNLTCEDHCRTQVLDANPTWNKNSPSWDHIDHTTAINAAIATCVSTDCEGLINKELNDHHDDRCESLKRQMIADVSADGPNGPGFHYIESSSSTFWQLVNTKCNNGTIILHDINGAAIAYPGLTDLRDPAIFQEQWAEDIWVCHREYCHYGECIADKNADNYELNMARAIDWNDANTKGYLNPLNLTSGQIGMTGINFVALDPWSASLPYTLFTANATFGNIWTFAQNSENGLYGTAFPFNITNQYKVWRSLYTAIRKEYIVNLRITGPPACPYYTDDNAIANPPYIPSSTTAAQFQDVNLQYLDNTDAQCDMNVQMWMDSLSQICGINSINYPDGIQTQYIKDIKNYLKQYCLNHSGLDNPLGIITDAAVLAVITNSSPDPNLLGAYNRIQQLGATGCSFYTVSIPNPYTHCTNGTYTYHTVATRFLETVRFLNNEYFPLSVPRCNPNCIYTDIRTLGYNVGSYYYVYATNTIINVKVNGSGDPCSANYMALYRLDGTQIYMNEINLIESPEYVSVLPSNAVTPSGLIFMNVKVKVRLLSGAFITAYIFQPSGYCNVDPGQYNTSLVKTLCTPDAINLPNPSFTTDQLRDSCRAQVRRQAIYDANQAYNNIIKDFSQKWLSSYYSNCFGGYSYENFKYSYPSREYHYTLYYYDQAGNLVQTVPPQGYKPVAAAAFDVDGKYNGTTEPTHTFLTKYLYNSLNKPITVETPDAGISKNYYDLQGRIAISQNDKQYNATQSLTAHSYTLYDQRSRVTEVGQVIGAPNITSANADATISAGVTTWLSTFQRGQVTQTFYDAAPAGTPNAQFSTSQPTYLRSRVAAVKLYQDDGAYYPTPILDHASYYSYDEHGNVKELVQDIPDLARFGAGVEYYTLRYKYDLISGNVNEVDYQNGKLDRLLHRYNYDADNRITAVCTSKDGLVWERDAKYFYYKHGPLARTEIGNDKVQGLDYAYTMQGWIKGINSNTIRSDRDMGADGAIAVGGGVGMNSYIGRDAMGYSLGYHGTDYSAIGGTTAQYWLAKTVGTPLTTVPGAYSNMYNGNISHMVTALEDNNENPMTIQGRTFQYDQLNRLRNVNAYKNFATVDLVAQNNSFTGATDNADYREAFVYDFNGNISTVNRKSYGAYQNMDNLQYYYYDKTGGVFASIIPFNYPATATNRLAYVTDGYAVTPAGYGDIKPGQATNNYQYDKIGNLKTDLTEEISNIDWTVYGKVSKITRTTGSGKSDIEFRYDGAGNRLVKIEKPRSVASGPREERYWIYTYYVRDAQGNQMAAYKRDMWVTANYTDRFSLLEQDIYGSSRLGIKTQPLGSLLLASETFSATTYNPTTLKYNRTSNLLVLPPAVSPDYSRNMGYKQYELTNHLGNVLTTVTDRKQLRQVNKEYYFEGFENCGCSSTDVAAQEGTKTCKLNSTNQYSPGLNTPVEPGDVIVNKVWAMYPSDGQPARGLLVVNLQDGSGNHIYINGVVQWFGVNFNSTTWTQYSYNYTVPSSGFTNSSGTPIATPSSFRMIAYVWNSSAYHAYSDQLEASITHNGTIKFVCYTPDVLNTTDYYAFGSQMPGRNFTSSIGYRFGFNGKESDFELKNSGGTSYDFGARMYDPRLGRWLSVDAKSNLGPGKSPYNFSSNSPLFMIDADGNWDIEIHALSNRSKYGYGIAIVKDNAGNVIYRATVRLEGSGGRDRFVKYSDTPTGVYDMLSWENWGGAYGPNDLIKMKPISGQIFDTKRTGIHNHGGGDYSDMPKKLKNTHGCIRWHDADIAELKAITDNLQASDPNEEMCTTKVIDDLVKRDGKYYAPEDIKEYNNNVGDQAIGNLTAKILNGGASKEEFKQMLNQSADENTQTIDCEQSNLVQKAVGGP